MTSLMTGGEHGSGPAFGADSGVAIPAGAGRPVSPAAGAAVPAGGAAATHRARQMLARARWAADAFATYDRATVLRIAQAVARAAHAQSGRYAERAVRETGCGVASDEAARNEAASLGILERYRDEDLVSPRADPAAQVLAVPRPAGVVLALTPPDSPVASVYVTVLLALLTRNAVVLSPHPLAQECSSDAARMLAQAAVSAGAPDGTVQVVPGATAAVTQALMADPVTDVVVVAGGAPVAGGAHPAGNTAPGAGRGNVPVLVDRTADLAAAARRIAASKGFDNSLPCTSESVLVVEDAAAGPLLRELERQQAVLLGEGDRDKVRAYLFPGGRLHDEAAGKDAAWIAGQAGVRVPPSTRVLLAPFDLVAGEEPLARQKPCPVLGVSRAGSAERGIQAARAVVRLGAAGHSAAVHSTDPRVILRYATRVQVLRVAVNAGNTTGSCGTRADLAASVTLGTSFAGRSCAGENLQPRHLVTWTRVACDAGGVPSDKFAQVAAWQPPGGPVPAYPRASNLPAGHGAGAGAAR